MTAFISIGTNANNALDDLISVAVHIGDTVKVQNLAASKNTINYHSDGHATVVSGTVAKNASTNLTTPGTHYLSCAGRADLIISGGQY